MKPKLAANPEEKLLTQYRDNANTAPPAKYVVRLKLGTNLAQL